MNLKNISVSENEWGYPLSGGGAIGRAKCTSQAGNSWVEGQGHLSGCIPRRHVSWTDRRALADDYGSDIYKVKGYDGCSCSKGRAMHSHGRSNIIAEWAKSQYRRHIKVGQLLEDAPGVTRVGMYKKDGRILYSAAMLLRNVVCVVWCELITRSGRMIFFRSGKTKVVSKWSTCPTAGLCIICTETNRIPGYGRKCVSIWVSRLIDGTSMN